MAEKEIRFIGLLANVDSTIMQLNLKHGYKIESITLVEGMKLFSQIEALPQSEVMNKLFMQFPCACEADKKFYFVS